MNVFYHSYVLHSRGGLNAVSRRREFHGALIKIDEGVGCLHPWPEFGDEEIQAQLELMRAGRSSKVIERALRMAQVDGDARRAGGSLFAGLEVPRCHYSWDHHQDFDEQIERITSEGWQAVKTKGWRQLDEVMKWLERFTTSTQETRLRMDFNSCLSESEYDFLISQLPEAVKSRFDFIEDPFPYDAKRWNAMRMKHGVKLALDKQLRGAAEGYDIAVLKPGRRDWREMVKDIPASMDLVLTSAMDHAVGQSFAAWEAACAFKELGSRVSLCGLSTEHLFAEDAFFKKLHSYGGILKPDSEGTTGLGFDDVLASLPWKKLV